nr:hypothetical protein B296_00027044 [Ipomoea trifida]
MTSITLCSITSVAGNRTRTAIGDMTYSGGDDNAGDDGDEGGVGDPGLPLTSNEVGEESGEKRGGGADGLVEGDREVTEGDIPADDGGAEDDAEGGDAEELGAGLDVLEIDELEEDNGDVAEERAGCHVAHGEEDWEGEAIIGEEIFVEEKNADIGGVPEEDQRQHEEGLPS